MSRRHPWARFGDDARGVSAVEFSILLPVLITLMFSGFAVSKTVAISRKLTITTRALADLTSQYVTLTTTNITTIFNASTQILAPFDATPLSMRLTEIQLDVTGLIATVTCSKTSGSQFAPYTKGVVFTNMPITMPRTPNASFIFAETGYVYTPPFGTAIISQIPLGDRIYMLPRVSTSVTFPGPC